MILYIYNIYIIYINNMHPFFKIISVLKGIVIEPVIIGIGEKFQ